ncbi:uncharacterized protein LACBIDRAFT_306348 [Laccaria bicolor S238N-H82]|uniref:Predicted protein n=1 Tax=Laccaria bicolor (strain S238N-H82 / ATCC MYA-4686) TaxID=486041 RepID=B0DN67_LACBS|nr:uncharacterized protein LACBIDRAFT_306348 [Laccaria bicolor S238N-H82]EDR04003.1 predicted protein [Laccaria bicolor S238N-H82]|eukprot:XP_001885258.1 predicted protein [Laccaria bicolor S238N-H82]
MPHNGSTRPGALPSLKKIFRIPISPHPSFGRFMRFLRRGNRRPAHSPPLLATPEGDHHLSRHPSSMFSRRATRNFGGPSTGTVDLGITCLYDINESLPFLDVAAANTDMDVSADEYTPYQNHASTSSAPPPLSALSGKFPANWESDGTTSAGLSATDIVFPNSLLGTGSLFSAAHPTTGSTSHTGPSAYPLLLGAEGARLDAHPTASTSQAGPFAHSFLLDVQTPNALGLHFADLSEETARPSRPSRPLTQYRQLPPLSPTSFTHDDESINEEHDNETPSTANDEPLHEPHQDATSSNSSYHSARESPSLQQQHLPDMTSAIAQRIISDYFKPSKLVIDREVSLIDMRSVLFALRDCLQDLTIGQIGTGESTWPSATPTIDMSHLASLKVDRVDFSFLKELLAYVRMDNLTALDLRVDSLESMPHELNVGWNRLEDLTLHNDFSPEVLNKVMDSLRDVNRLKWSGKLARANHNKCSFKLESLQDLTVCSNEDGCAFFLGCIISSTLQTLHLSHFSLDHPRHGFLGVRNIFIENKIDANQFLAILTHFPTLLSADFGIGSTAPTENFESLCMQQEFAQLDSLTLRNVSAPIRPLLMSIPLFELTSLEMLFDLKADKKHQFCLGLADCLQTEEGVRLKTLRLVDANLTREELRSCLEIVGPTLVDYQVQRTSLEGDGQL